MPALLQHVASRGVQRTSNGSAIGASRCPAGALSTCSAGWRKTYISQIVELVEMVMPYALHEYDEATQMQYLDWCHEAGVKVLYDVSRLGFSATGAALPIADNYTNDWALEAWVAVVKGNVSLVNEPFWLSTSATVSQLHTLESAGH